MALPPSLKRLGVGGAACAKGRERTVLQDWGFTPGPHDLRGDFRSARIVAYLLEGRSAACAPRWASMRLAAPAVVQQCGAQDPAHHRGRLPGAERGLGQAAGAPGSSLGLLGEGQLGGLSQSGDRQDAWGENSTQLLGEGVRDPPKPHFCIENKNSMGEKTPHFQKQCLQKKRKNKHKTYRHPHGEQLKHRFRMLLLVASFK